MQIHGGDIYQNDVELDYSANINPFGMPERVKEEAIRGVYDSIHYPDMRCGKLTTAIAKKEGVRENFIICGNGAAEVIFQLVRAVGPRKAILPAPTFGEYEKALHAVRCEIQHYELKEEQGFQITSKFLEALTKDVDIVFLCNPNNPTGETVPSELLRAIVTRCKENQILLVMDECFQDFLSESDGESLRFQCEGNPYLFILKAFTKMYGMAGLRLGYGITSDIELIQKMKNNTQAWNVSIPAQYAGVAACEEEEFAAHTREYIVNCRKYLIQELQCLGLTVYGSKANYIFFRGPKGLYETMLKRKILIRSCMSYQGLNETYYRIAVKRQEENEIFISYLKEGLEELYG